MIVDDVLILDVEGLIKNHTIPDYYYISGLESGNLRRILNDFIINQPHTGYYTAGICVFLSFAIQRLMKNQPAFKLQKLSFCWNVLLMIVNAVATARILPLLIHLLNEENFFESICTNRRFISDPVCGSWLILFLFIKIVELGDIIFIVLQKRRLHTYLLCHHILAVSAAWYLFPAYAAISVWICSLVSASHIPVYLYGVVHTLNIKVPKIFKYILLFSELLTVFLGAVICMCVLYYQLKGANCNLSLIEVSVMVFIFTSCILLCVILIYEKTCKRSKKS